MRLIGDACCLCQCQFISYLPYFTLSNYTQLSYLVREVKLNQFIHIIEHRDDMHHFMVVQLLTTQNTHQTFSY